MIRVIKRLKDLLDVAPPVEGLFLVAAPGDRFGWGDPLTEDVRNALNNAVTEAERAYWNAKLNPDSPELLGTPTAPTAPVGTSTNQIATTEFVINEIDELKDELEEPDTGNLLINGGYF